MANLNAISLISTENFLTISGKREDKIAKKLSSGYKINSSSDDAAGLSISEKMRSQIRGLNQASQNIQDGISYAQTADSALGEVQSILHRMNELSVKSANDTNTSSDRAAIDKEVQQLKKQINSIFTNTEFNMEKVWDEDIQNRTQIGVEQVDAVTSTLVTTTGVLNNTNKASIPDDNIYTFSADTDGIRVLWDSYNGDAYSSQTIPWPSPLEGEHNFQLSDYVDLTSNPELTGINFVYEYSVDDAATLTDVINSLDNVSVYNMPYYSINSIPYSEDGNGLDGISFSSSIIYPAILASGKDLEAYDDDFMEASVGGTITTNNIISDPTNSMSSSSWSFEFEMPGIGTVTATSVSTDYYSNWKDPNQDWWGVNSLGHEYSKVYTPTPNDGSLDSVNACLVNSGLDLVNDSDQGGYIRVSFDITANSNYSLPNGTLYSSVGSMTMGISVGATDTVDTISDRLKNISGIDIDAGNAVTNAPSNTNYMSRGYNVNAVEIDSPLYKYYMNLNIQSGANEGENINIAYDSLNNRLLGIDDLSVTTRENSSNAITSISEALTMVSSQRSLFGAYQNRMEHAIGNVDSMSENTSSAESLIRDADLAKEMVAYSKEGILRQVGQSILAQSVKSADSVLNLLE